MSSLPPAIFLMGPTASGKTDLAIALSQHLPCELISVDSALVYRGMDIGTAKPEAELLQRFPHHLIDIRDPAQPYSAASFREDALALMADITGRGRIPLLVGGTMLYFKALLDGLGELPGADTTLRAAIEAEAALHGWPAIHAQLARVDPEAAARIQPTDPQRLQRALEVYRLTGTSLSEWHRRQNQGGVVNAQGFMLPYHVWQLAIAPRDRRILHERIARRFHQMVEQGLLEEVKVLFERGDLHKNLPAIRAVGYRQVWEHFEGLLDHSEMVERGIIATRQLAKRQLTWLRGWPDLEWLYTDTVAGEPLAFAQVLDAALTCLRRAGFEFCV